MKTTTLPLKHSMNRVPFRLALLLIPLALAYFALSPLAQAVCQEGCDTVNENTFLGDDALFSNTTGSNNTAVGSGALKSNTSGDDNTAIGLAALGFNTTGHNNTATGESALHNNTIGAENTATGGGALFNNTTGNNNLANGANALFGNTTGFFNVANGSFAMVHNTIGSYNVAEGLNALFNNTTGSLNIAIGLGAGVNLTTGNNNIEIGNAGVAGEAGKIRLGTRGTHTNTYIAGIGGVTVAGGVGVIIDTTGHLGTVVSSARYKDNIKPMDNASEAILALKPVTFRYKHELDPEGIPQFGLVAEDVEKVNPALVARDEQGKPYTVRYEAVNAMLLNEFLRAHRKIEEQGATIAKQQKQIEALNTGLQRVSAQLELSKPAPKTVNNR